jgi:hypothetical protein
MKEDFISQTTNEISELYSKANKFFHSHAVLYAHKNGNVLSRYIMEAVYPPLKSPNVDYKQAYKELNEGTYIMHAPSQLSKIQLKYFHKIHRANLMEFVGSLFCIPSVIALILLSRNTRYASASYYLIANSTEKQFNKLFRAKASLINMALGLIGAYSFTHVGLTVFSITTKYLSANNSEIQIYEEYKIKINNIAK